MEISVDAGKCVGSGQCAWVAPQVFDQSDEDGTVVLVQPKPPRELHDVVREALLVCPADAIKMEGIEETG